MPFGHGGAGGAETLLLRVMKRRYVSMVQKGSMPDLRQSKRDATGERSVSLAKIVL